MRIVIIGGGLSGLSCAYHLERRWPSTRDLQLTLLEGSDRFGGVLETVKRDEFLFDRGGDSWVSQKREATVLATELGLKDELIRTLPTAKRVYVVHDGKLVPMPDGLAFGAPTQILPILRSPLYSLPGKLRMALDVVLPRGAPEGDESVGAFVTRRLGLEAKEAVIGPLLGGIFSGDVDELSLLGSFPQLREAERKHRSLILALRKRARENAARGETSTFTSLRLGMSQLVTALASALTKTDLRKGVPVESVTRKAETYVVTTKQGSFEADAVVVACSPVVANRLLREAAPDVSVELSKIGFGTSATVHYAFEKASVSHALDGSGFIAPKREGRAINAATFVSSKWPGRAPAGRALMRTFFAEPAAFESDAELVVRGLAELRALVGVRGEPLFTEVSRFRDASPRMTVGHLDRVSGMKSRLADALPNVHLLGAGYDVAGISDCAKAGRELAEQLAARS